MILGRGPGLELRLAVVIGDWGFPIAQVPSRSLLKLRAATAGSRVLPVEPLGFVAGKLGGCFGPRLAKGKAQQFARNMARVQPGLDRDQATQIVRDGFASYSRYFADSFRLPSISDRTLDRAFSFQGYAKVLDSLASGVGPILVLPHVGSWEWAAAWMGRIEKRPVAAVVEVLEPPDVFDWFTKLRSSYGVEVIPLGPLAMASLAKAVKAPKTVCLLADRDISGNGVEVEFFAETTRLPAGPALLSLRTGAPLIPSAVFFHDNFRHIILGDPISTKRTNDFKGDIARITQAMASELERLILMAPSQWHLLGPNWPSDTAVSSAAVSTNGLST